MPFGFLAMVRAQGRVGDVASVRCLAGDRPSSARRGCGVVKRLGGVFGLCAVVSQACGERVGGALEDLRKIV